MKLDETTFESGARRSGDANETRYDLLTPIGLDALARFYADWPSYNDGPGDDGHDEGVLLGNALFHIYRFLRGFRGHSNQSPLAAATAAIMVAISIRVGGKLRRSPFAQSKESTAKFRYDLIPPEGLAAVARRSKMGAERYGEFNWERGMPVHDLLNHAIRHLILDLSGDRSDDNLGAAAWGCLAAIHSLDRFGHLNSANLRSYDCSLTPEILAAQEEFNRRKDESKAKDLG